MSKPLTVAIIEDLREVRESLTTLVNGTPGFRAAGSFRTMEEALRVWGAHKIERRHAKRSTSFPSSGP